jgi:capsular exopolysaccharide synthesis family protein
MNKPADTSIISINDIKSLGRILLKNWYILLFFTAASYAAAYLYVYRLTDVYSASMQILLKSNDIYDSRSIISTNSTGFKDYTENYNAMRIMKSYDLISKTVDRLNLDVSYFISGRLRTKEIYDGLPFEVKPTAINPSMFQKFIQLKIISTEKYKLIYDSGGNSVEKTGEFDKPLVCPDFQIVIQNKSIREPMLNTIQDVNYLFVLQNKGALIRKYKSSLNVNIPEYTGILEVSVEDIIPQRAVTFLDTLGKVYIENTLISKFEINERTLNYIEKQIEELKESMNIIETRLQSFRKSESILDLSREQNSYFNQLVVFQTEQKTLEMQFAEYGRLKKYLIEGANNRALPNTMFVNSNDILLANSMNELHKAQMDLSVQEYSSGKASFEVNELKIRVGKIKTDLLSYIVSAENSIAQRLKDIEKQISGLENVLIDIPVKQRELINIERNLEVNQKMYSYLLEKRSENIIARAGIVSESKIIESARNKGIVRPDKNKIRMSFIGVGVFISILIIFIRQLLFESLDNIDILKTKTTKPVLGDVAFAKIQNENEIAVVSDPRSIVTESFRAIRTNMQFILPRADSKILSFTSNSPAEGKTFCSVNLAALLAKSGKKVLLLEFDLHKPRVHQALKMNADKGLTTILINKAEPDECVLKTSIENLFVILSGPSAPNSSELLYSESLDKIFKYGRENFDYVIVDTPPVGLLTDPLILMKKSDANIYVINANIPYRDSLKTLSEITESNQISNIFLVLNGVKQKSSKYYYNKYSKYGYGYGSSQA